MLRRASFIGQGRLLVACAQTWLAHGHRIDAIVSANSEIAEWARAQGVALVASPEALGETDYIFSIVNHALLPAAVIARARVAAINFHDSLLPHYSGFNATSWAIRDGQTRHGVTWHLMSAEADSGAVLARQAVDILADETAFTLSARCDGAGQESFEALLTALGAGDGVPEPLGAGEPRQDFRLRHERPGLGIVQFDRDAAASLAEIRALDFGREDNWMTRAKLDTPAGLFIIEEARLVEAPQAAPGTVIACDENRLVIAAADGALCIERLSQLDGTPAAPGDTGLAPGAQLPARTHAQRAEEALADAAFSPHERFWTARLATLTPIEIAGLRAHTQIAEPATYRDPEAGALASLGADEKAHLLIAALTAYGLRSGDQTTMDVSLYKPVPAPLAGAYGSFVPLRLTADRQATGTHILAAAETELSTQTRRGLYARDIVTRYRRLRNAGHAACPLALFIGAHPSAEALMVGAVRIALITGAAGQAPHWVYDRQAISDDAFARFAARIHHLAGQWLTAPQTPVWQLDLLLPQEREQLTITWQDTAVPVCEPALIHRLFEAQAARTPHATALIFRNATITYQDLNRRADALAQSLQARGVGADKLVGVCLNRSIEMMIALLGVLKAGGAYVPMDPAYPRERLAMMREDADLSVILTTRALAEDLAFESHLTLFTDEFPHAPSGLDLADRTASDHLAYVIFTSGSTGRPKGVMVSHGNAANFFTGMDQRLGTSPGVWLATTSISFDISVLELFWTLCRGFKVILQPEADRASLESAAAIRVSPKPMDFSLFYFAATDGATGDPYRLLTEGAKFADTHDFSAVWTPERHFHAFGGPYPNPALTSAALSTITSRVGLRAGSVVLPLHNPVRVAEDWALIDQLSGGRAGLSFASGWHANDFALMPEAYDQRRDLMLAHIDTVMKLWRGEAIEAVSGNGKTISIRTFPRPVQARPPLWFTAAGNPESFRLAGETGANLLTNMLGQDLADLEAKIRALSQGTARGRSSGRGHRIGDAAHIRVR